MEDRLLICPIFSWFKLTRNKGSQGFTLAELLIALGILGVIATFTIPKILNAQQSSQKKAQAKEIASTLAQAYALYKMQNGVTTATKPSDLTPYLNYVSIDTTSTIDWHPTMSSRTCSPTTICLKLHNAPGLLYMADGQPMGGTATNYAIEFEYDPDGVYSGSTADSAGKSVQFHIYYDGFITSRAYVRSNTCNGGGGGCFGSDASTDPSWFNWN